MWKCNACNGTYTDTQRDGSVYMHACAPTIPSGGAQVPVVNPRDENLKLDLRGRAIDIKLPGAGVTSMGGQITVEPAWILQIRAAAVLPVAT